MSYYNENFKEYIDKTINSNMTLQYKFLEKHTVKNASILDVGFGSGRDMIYFKNKGYKVKGIDIEEKFIDHAKSIHLDVEYGDALYYNSLEKFDIIWCCASLLHLTFEDISKAINNLKKLLNSNGLIYLSFKYGDFEGFIDDRYFTYINEEKLEKLHLNIIDKLITKDVSDRNIQWLNLIIK